MTNPIQTIKDLTQSALGDINAAATLAELEKVRVAVLGRKGELAGISKTFGAMVPEDRAKAGQLLNEAKATLEKSFEDRKASLEGWGRRRRCRPDHVATRPCAVRSAPAPPSRSCCHRDNNPGSRLSSNS